MSDYDYQQFNSNCYPLETPSRDSWFTDVGEWPGAETENDPALDTRKIAAEALQRAHPSFSVLITEKHAYIGTCQNCRLEIVTINGADVVKRFKAKLDAHACATTSTLNRR